MWWREICADDGKDSGLKDSELRDVGLSSPNCPLCSATNSVQLFTIEQRAFFECQGCDLLFAVPDSLLSQEQEKARYCLHENTPDNKGYVTHLSRLKTQLAPKLTSGMRGLDFGSGPLSVLSQLFENDQFKMECYDPFFGPPLTSESGRYDFITCTEAAEHFKDPSSEFKLMHSLLKPGGWIAIMTNLREEGRRDSTWWYLRDPSHRCFYSKKTFEMLGTILSWRLNSITDDIVLLQNI